MEQEEKIDTLILEWASQQQQHTDPALDSTVLSMPKSSMGSTGVLVDDALLARYPIDDINETTTCELHMKLKNIYMKVAVGFDLPNEPEVTIPSNPIPAGYARVGVDKLMSGYDSLELNIPGGQEERTLGDATRIVILWRNTTKKIHFRDDTCLSQ